MSEQVKLERELKKVEAKMREALEQQAEAEYEYQSWSKERFNLLKAIDALNCVDRSMASADPKVKMTKNSKE